MIPTSKVVNVSITTNPAFPTVQGFGVLAIIGISNSLPYGQRMRTYSTLAGVAADFGALTEEYLAATAFFSQNPTPNVLNIGRRFNTNTPGELLGSLSANKVLASYTFNNASLRVIVDGTTVNVIGLDLTAAANLNAVAASLQTALAVIKPGMTVSWTGSQFIVRSGTTGATSTIAASTASGVGVDLGPLMGLTTAAGVVVTPGALADVSVGASLDALAALSLPFYAFMFTKEVVTADLLTAAAWAEANNRIFGYTTADPTTLDPLNNGDIGSQLKALGYSRTIGQYDGTSPYAIASALAFAFSVNFAAPNSTITLKFKLEPGVVPDNITETQRLALVGKNLNYYTFFGSSAMLAEGVVANGRFFDEVFGLDWLRNTIQTNVFGYLYTATTKIPQTDKGMARVMQPVILGCQQGVKNGLLAPGTWVGPPLGTIKTGDLLPKGFYVWADSVVNQLPADRAARLAPPITVLAKGAGAIHGINVVISFEQ